ncbi:hypothetical protein L207DRAFT_507599 [Hyaloscypha variabilis F]|uniref:2EXR domain-containing protein n=1 Tax=Hyaloscypha variabilis (strain UAMH 11265 / GT02V1 / F) TaxID=1149755 RepID=A0A2J6S7G6_HYAVF|nr:hypothetical protein L207DRAFT_507599 [Hyaloscypha variabilis F]
MSEQTLAFEEIFAVASPCLDIQREHIGTNSEDVSSVRTRSGADSPSQTETRDQMACFTPTEGASGADSTKAVPIPSTFTVFPKLPLELRRMIWSFALSKPRILCMRTFGHETWVRAPRRITLMSVNRESRSISMERHNLIRMPPPIDYLATSDPFYFSPVNDVCIMTARSLIKGWSATSNQTHMALRDSVRVLAVGSLDRYSSLRAAPFLRFMHVVPPSTICEAKKLFGGLATFRSLEKLILLQGPKMEKFMADIMQYLRSERDNYSLGRLPLVLEHLEEVTVLHYEYDEGADVMKVMEKVLLTYLEK